MGEPAPVTALVLAAGSGTRLPGAHPKGFRSLGGEPMFLHALRAFDQAPSIGRHVLVIPDGREDEARSHLAGRIKKELCFVAGGPRRQDSVLRGLEAAERGAPGGSGQSALVAVHDAARPFVGVDLIERIVASARDSGGAIPMVPVVETVRERATTGDLKLVDRDRLLAAQTPQTARADWLIEAYRLAQETGVYVTDEGAALELSGRRFAIVPGDPSNFKITTPADFAMAEAILGANDRSTDMRIGFGEDRHTRAAERRFVLAGVVLENRNGPLGHSDGDPLCHAVVDALLGAAGAGTIGDLFPDTDPRWEGASGLDLLRRVVARLAQERWRTVNVDAVVIMDSPRLGPHTPEIRRRIGAILGIDLGRVSVKGKRAEGLGFEGTGGGVSCRAVVMIARVDRA